MDRLQLAVPRSKQGSSGSTVYLYGKREKPALSIEDILPLRYSRRTHPSSSGIYLGSGRQAVLTRQPAHRRIPPCGAATFRTPPPEKRREKQS